MHVFKVPCSRHLPIYAWVIFYFFTISPIVTGQAKLEGNVAIHCAQLNEEYRTKAAERDYMKIIKIYQILETSYKGATSHEQEMIIKTVQKGFRFASPPGASKDFRTQGVDCLIGMGIDGLKALLFSLEHKRTELTDVDKLAGVLGEAYKNGAPFEEEMIATIYDIFTATYEEIEASEKQAILKSLEKAFRVKTVEKEGEFKIAAASHLAGMDMQGMQTLLGAVKTHKAAGLSYPVTKWDRVIKPLKDVLYAEYGRKRKCDEKKVILIFNIFTELYPHFNKSQQKSVTAYFIKASRALPLPEKEACLLTAADAMSGMGKIGLDALEYLLKNDRLDGIWNVLSRVIIAIGRTKDPSALDTLVQLLWDDYPVKINAACMALSYYSSAPLKMRKAIVKDIVKVYANLYTLVQGKNPSNVNAERYYATRGQMNMVLSKLTNQRFSTAPQWQKWFNDNKGKPRW